MDGSGIFFVVAWVAIAAFFFQQKLGAIVALGGGFILACIGVIIFAQITRPATEKTSTDSAPVRAEIANWYEGGTLQKATANAWHTASMQNRLATSADFIAGAKAAESMEELEVRAVALEQCITDATDDTRLQNQKITDVAVSCIILLGYQ